MNHPKITNLESKQASLMSEIKKQLIELIKLVCEEKNGNPTLPLKIDSSTDLRNDLQLDSLELAELTVRIEDAFGIDIFEDGMVNSVGDIFKIFKI